jgi:hypothetical protein
MSDTKSSQGTRVQQELDILRTKNLAKNQREKLKNCTLCNFWLLLFCTYVASVVLIALPQLTFFYHKYCFDISQYVLH